jgi:His/Glu/Gln/Arg/opine family amino acid ABC transporter permease subunit
LLGGALVTLVLTSVSTFFGMIAGIVIGIARLSANRWISLAARCYIDFFRGTPLLVQILLLYFGIPGVIKDLGLNFTLDRPAAAIIALSLNCAAYLAEIIRGGIQSIDPGQREAAESLGLSPVQTMKDVIFPQAFRRMIPPLGNEFITLLKDTSLVMVIGFEEILRKAQLIIAVNFKPFQIYILAAFIYLALTLLSSQAVSWLERSMNPVEKARRKAMRSPLV